MSLVWASLPFSSQKGLNALKIDKKLIRHIAALAKLEIDENDIDKWIGQMNEIIAFADRLNEFNLQDFSETAHGFDAPGVFLEDVRKPSYPREAMLANAPDVEGGCYSVPIIVE